MPAAGKTHVEERIHAVEPSESLIPKIPNMNLLAALVIAPIIVMVLAGQAMEAAEGSAAKDLWFMLTMLFLVIEIVGLVILFTVGISVRKKLSAASRKIADSLRWEHGITVDRPKMLILTDKSKPRLNPYDIQAVDTYGRPISLNITTDETGTKVVPSLCEEHTEHLANARKFGK